MRKLFACLIALAALGWQPAWSAVANQGCTPTVGSTSGQHFSSNTSFSLTNVTVSAGSHLALTLQVHTDIGSVTTTPTVVSAVWDQAGANQSLSSVNAGQVTGQGANIETWALINPTPGSNKTITVTISAAAPVFLDACAWTGVDQTGGATSFPHKSTSQNTTTVSVTSATGNAVLGGGDSGAGLSGITGTTIFSDSVNGAVVNSFANFASGSASVTIGSGNTNAVVSATDIKAAAASASACGNLPLMGVGC